MLCYGQPIEAVREQRTGRATGKIDKVGPSAQSGDHPRDIDAAATRVMDLVECSQFDGWLDMLGITGNINRRIERYAQNRLHVSSIQSDPRTSDSM